jgi:YD repeat-containing protein
MPRSVRFALIALGTLLGVLARAVPIPQIEISPPSSANEFRRTASLVWNAQRDSIYKVQSALTLGTAPTWITEDIVISSSNGPAQWMAPESLGTTKFYRLVLPQPEVFSVEPTFIDSSDPTALLYIIGQLLPTNGLVMINGHVLTPTIINSNGVWAAVSLNGLPPGEPVIGTLTVMDSASNVVATLPVQSPILYGTELTSEQLQGPPEEPPAVVKTKTKSNQSNDWMFTGGGGSGQPTSRWVNGKWRTPVTRSNISNNRTAGGSGGGGGIIGQPTPDMAEQGKSTPVTRSNISNNRTVGGGIGLDPVDFATGDAFFRSAVGLKSETEVFEYQEGGNNDGVVLASGEFRQRAVDLVIPGPGFDFAWTRTYRSRTGSMTGLGHGWDFSYNMSLDLQPDGTVQFCSGNGRCDTFYPNGTNGWSRDEFFMTIGDLNKDGIPDVVICANGTRVNFNPIVTDKPVSIVDRNNNTMLFFYDGLGRLTTIVDTLGRSNLVSYNSSGLVGSLTDFSGRTVRYEYDTNDDLIACVSPAVTGTPNGNDFSGGKTNHYAYSSGFGDDRLNHNLVACTDAKGQTWLQIVYQPTNNPASIDFDSVAYLMRGVDRKDVWRGRVTPSPTNGFAMTQVIVRDAVGNVAECFYDSRQRCVIERDYTGRADTGSPTTPTTNRPMKKLRPDDPDYFETQWQWNNDSLCESIVSGGNSLGDGSGRINRVRLTYSRDFDASASPIKKGDLMTLREFACCGGADLDGDGTADITDRAWHFQYHPSFGSPAGRNIGIYVSNGSGQSGNSNLRTRLDALETKLHNFGLMGLIVPSGNGVAINTKGTGADKGRVAGVPLGNGVAINTKGTGADKNRIAGVPLGNGVAINTKGTGADKGRIAGVPLGNGVAINTKGTGADKNRFANGPRQTTSMDGTFGHISSGRILNYEGEDCDDGNTDEDCDNFMTSITDPRGTVATQDYDNHGNPIIETIGFNGGNGVEVRATTRRNYNSRGQLIAITNAPDANGYTRVDTFDYYTNGPQAGYCRQFTVDAAGPVVTITKFEYDARGNVTRCVDPRTNDWLFTWNQLDQLVERQTPDRGFGARTATTYSYDENDNVQSAVEEVRDENDNLRYGHAISIGHDYVDRITSIVEQVSPNQFITNRFDYDGNDNVTTVYSPMAVSGADPDNYTSLAYDERGLMWKLIETPINAGKCTTEYSYDEVGQLKTVINGMEDPSPATYSFGYDGFGRCVSVSDPMGNVATYAYDRGDNLVFYQAYCETNDVPGGTGNLRYQEWRWTNNELGQCIQSSGSFFDPATQLIIGDGLSVTRYTYAPNGACTSVTDDNSHTTTFSYDTVGRLASVTDAKSNSVAYAYDPNGNVVSVTQTDHSDVTPTTQQFSVNYSYDALDRCVSRGDNVGNTSSYFYDSLGRIVRAINPNGSASFWTYDDLGRCTLTVADKNSDGIPDVAVDVNHSWAYDDNSRCISSTDDNTNTTSYAYDSHDRIVATTEADGTVCSLIWSPRSNLIRQQDANGTVVSNNFDALGRCISRQITPGSGVAATTTFESYGYDGLSRLTAASNDHTVVIFAYDSCGNSDSVNENGRAILCTYDGVGNRTSITYPSGLAVGYIYDACDQVSQITRCEGCGNPWLGELVATYAYEGPGRIGRIARENGVNTRVSWNGVSGTPNATGDFGWRQVSGVNHQVAGGGTIIDQRTMMYDGNQNKLQRAQIAPFIPGGSMNTNQFVYDSLDRLVTSTRSSSAGDYVFKSYTLDGNGNRQFVISNGMFQPYQMDNTPPPGPADFQMNQYTVTPFGSQSFDENGNLAGRSSAAGQLQFQYDYADHLVAVNDLSGGLPSPLATFAYDALGRRISKTIYPPQPAPPVTTEYVVDADCDGDPALLETRVDGVLTARFVLDGTRSHDDEVVRLTGSGQPQYFHGDDLGNVLALTDAGGNVIERYEYDDFGAPSFLTSDGVPMGTNASPVGNPFLFHGMEWDAEVNLYLGHSQGGTCGPALRWENDPYSEDAQRAYDPFTGRYLLRAGAPLKFDAATAFAGNNPWSRPGKSSFKLAPANGGVERAGFGNAFLTRPVLKTFFEKGDAPTQGQ